MKEEVNDIMTLDSITTASELDAIISGKSNNTTIQEMLKPYNDLTSYSSKIKQGRVLETGSERLFVGDRLWLVYSTMIAVYGRFGFLINKIHRTRKIY